MKESLISIELVDNMGTDLSVVNAARVSYGQVSTSMSDRDLGLVKFLAEHNHVTPFRHTAITLRCKAPIFIARQLGKHQVGFSWNEISRRYKDDKAIPIQCFVPSIVMGRPESLMKDRPEPLDKHKQSAMKATILSANVSAYNSYLTLIENGVAPEQARMVLPQGMITEWIWTGSLFGFAALYKQRSADGAQYEVRVFAEELHKIMSKLYPICWGALTNKG